MFTLAVRCEAQVYVDSTGWSVTHSYNAWDKMQPYYNRKNEGGLIWLMMRTSAMFLGFNYIDKHKPKTWVIFTLQIPDGQHLVFDQSSGFLIDNVYCSLQWMVTLEHGKKVYISTEIHAPVFVDNEWFDKNKEGEVIIYCRFGQEIKKIQFLKPYGITLKE